MSAAVILEQTVDVGCALKGQAVREQLTVGVRQGAGVDLGDEHRVGTAGDVNHHMVIHERGIVARCFGGSRGGGRRRV